MPPGPPLPAEDRARSFRASALLGARGQSILHTGAWSVVAKACGAANFLLSVPFVLHALGPERFGVWATLCAFSAFAGFLDFGFANGAMNLVASARGRGAEHELPAIVSAAFRALAVSTGWLALFAFLGWWLLPWPRWLGLPPALVQEGFAAAGFVVLATLLAVPLGLATRVQLGLGRGQRAYRWQAIANLLTLGAVLLLCRAGASLPAITAASVLLPLAGLLVNSTQLLRDARRAPAHLERAERRALSRDMRRSGLQFFLLQLSAVVAFSTDLPLLSAQLGPAKAAEFAIVHRLFALIPMGLSLVWVPLWPEYRHALAAGDHAWVARTFRRSLFGAPALAALAALVFVAGFGPLTSLWLGHAAQASLWLLCGFALWCTADAACSAVATFLNSAEIMRPQVVVALTLAALCLVFKVWAIGRFGLDAVIWVTGILLVTVNLLPLFLMRKRLADTVRAKTY